MTVSQFPTFSDRSWLSAVPASVPFRHDRCSLFWGTDGSARLALSSLRVFPELLGAFLLLFTVPALSLCRYRRNSVWTCCLAPARLTSYEKKRRSDRF